MCLSTKNFLKTDVIHRAAKMIFRVKKLFKTSQVAILFGTVQMWLGTQKSRPAPNISPPP